MSETVIHWRLGEIMVRHDVTGIVLAEKLGITPKAISNLKRSKTMPRLDGKALERICIALSEIIGKTITPTDLIDYEVENSVGTA